MRLLEKAEMMLGAYGVMNRPQSSRIARAYFGDRSGWHADFVSAIETICSACEIPTLSYPEGVAAELYVDGVTRLVFVSKKEHVAEFAGFCSGTDAGKATRAQLRRVLDANEADEFGSYRVRCVGKQAHLVYAARWPIALLDEALILTFIWMTASGVDRGESLMIEK